MAGAESRIPRNAVILREVAGSTLANDAAACVDSATARGMTALAPPSSCAKSQDPRRRTMPPRAWIPRLRAQ